MASKPSSEAKPTIETIQYWDAGTLLEWIQQNHPRLLKDDAPEKFKAQGISGDDFLALAGDVRFFKEECSLPGVTSTRLANLASELAGRETTGTKRNRQQAEDVEMTDAVDTKIGSTEFEASLVLDSHISYRQETVTRLAMLLDSQWVVHVRGTPATGKTTLAYLLRRYYQSFGKRVVLFTRPRRPSNISLTSYLAEKCEMEGFFGTRLDFFSHTGIIFIIDEAQTAYHDGDLWEFIKSMGDNKLGPKFCIFTVYGSPSQGLQSRTDPTPDTLHSVEQVSILPSHRKNSLGICLFFNETDFEDVLMRYCAHPGHKLPLDGSARTYLYSITNGHPGAVYSMLIYFYTIYGPRLKAGKMEQVTENDLVESLMDDADVFSSLTHSVYPVHRSFPSKDKLSVPAKEVLSTILRDGSVPFEFNNDGMELCFQEGWIHVDSKNGDLIGFLPSRLHEKYIEFFITSMDPSPFPHHKFPNLRELCIAVLREFSRKSLSLSTAERGPTVAAGRTLESQYQDEFYRAFTSLLGSNVGISSEWSRSKESSNSKGGRIDFRILGPKWGVELLRDGTMHTLDEHYKRFLSNGKYHKWISKGLISDWLVIDCRCSMPEGYAISRPNLWHAIFAEDYSTLRIIDASNQEIMPEVCLMG